MLHQIKAPQFYTDLALQITVLSPLAKVKFKDFSRPLSVFQVLFKANLFSRTFQDSTVYSSTFQACANPEEMKKVNKQCLLDTPRTERVSDKTWQVIVRTRRP